MIPAIETGSRPALSFAAWPRLIPQETTSRFFLSNTRTAEPQVSSRSLPPRPVANVVSPILTQLLGRGRQIVAEGPKIGLPPLPGSEAESVFSARTDEAPALSPNVIVAEGVDYSGLDASWKVIPTAEFDDTPVIDRVERLM